MNQLKYRFGWAGKLKVWVLVFGVYVDATSYGMISGWGSLSVLNEKFVFPDPETYAVKWARHQYEGLYSTGTLKK